MELKAIYCQISFSILPQRQSLNKEQRALHQGKAEALFHSLAHLLILLVVALLLLWLLWWRLLLLRRLLLLVVVVRLSRGRCLAVALAVALAVSWVLTVVAVVILVVVALVVTLVVALAVALGGEREIEDNPLISIHFLLYNVVPHCHIRYHLVVSSLAVMWRPIVTSPRWLAAVVSAA